MTAHSASLLIGLAIFAPAGFVMAGPLTSVAGYSVPSIVLAQASNDTNPPAAAAPPAETTAPAAPVAGAPPPAAGVQSIYPSTSSAPPAPAQDPSGSPTGGATGAAPPVLTETTRNGALAPQTPTQASTGQQDTGGSSSTYGGPPVDTSPVYGSTMRDNGTGNGGVPIYGGGLGTSGGPVNGTRSSAPFGAPSPGQGTAARGGRTADQPIGSDSTLQPLGGRPYTRDQGGTFGGRAGYSAGGVYNGTAAQAGVGYGSPFAPGGRPTGGLLSTNADATGPLRPYVPLNNGPIGATNSGYGVPNGSRPTHIDGRGVQRVN